MASSVVEKPSIHLVSIKSLEAEVYNSRLIITAYTDDTRQNGFKFDVDMSSNYLSGAKITNGTSAITNQIAFTRV